MVEEGIKLAEKRRVELRQLIAIDPRQAIESAVPPVVRQQLPIALVERLEERVNEVAFFGVLGVVASSPDAPVPAYRREVRTSDGGRYQAFVYGRRLSQRTTEKASIVGIAVDDFLAVDERPLRTMASGEIPNHPNNLTRRRTATPFDQRGFIGEREVRTTPAPPHEVVEICPISGSTTAGPEEAAAVSAADVVVEAHGQIQILCRGGHIQTLEEQLIAQEGGNGGAVLPNSPPVATQSTGYRTNLLMRVAFPEALKAAVTEMEGHDLGKGVQDWFVDSSYGALTFMTTVTPLIVLPRSEAWYKDQDTNGAAYEVLNDARVAAKAAGFDPANFDFDTVIYTGSPGSFGGQAWVGAKGCWLKSGNLGTSCHEYGHNLGLWHANFWSTSTGSAIGGGSHSEYGDSFDTMGTGNAGDNHYNIFEKNLLNWLPTPLVHEVTTSGTYRIYPMDQPALNPQLRYAIKTRKDTDRDYWIDFRQKFATNAWVQGGVFVHWSPWSSSGGGTHLLDTTPGSIDGKNDAPVVIGRTFSDTETGIHITPISKNATTPPSTDVVVNLGFFPGNSTPVVAASASATSVATNVTVNFTATASDGDGDVLSYAWEFGDKTFSTTNSPTVSKSWSTAGEYRVRCTVSDMKGKTASASVIITVGSPGTFRIAGTVTVAGQPLADVRVTNSKIFSSYREAITDANGTYTLVGLVAGTYTVTPQIYGYTLTPETFTVTVGPNAGGMNFTAVAQPANIPVQAAEPTGATSSAAGAVPGDDLPILSVVATDSAAAEAGNDPGVITVTRTGSTAAELTVNYGLSGSALHGTDYVALPGVLTIPAGSSVGTVVITPINDAIGEAAQTVVFQLRGGLSYGVSPSGNATVTIADNDVPYASIAVTTGPAIEGGTSGVFRVTTTGTGTGTVTVRYSVTGTATNGTDYTLLGGTVTMNKNATSNITIAPIQDTSAEGYETVTVTLTPDPAYSLAVDSSATMNLQDDEDPQVNVVASDETFSESRGSLARFFVSRTGATTSALTVNYTLGGTATAGVDYTAPSGSVTLAAGSADAYVNVSMLADTLAEGTETVVFNVTSNAAYVPGIGSATHYLADAQSSSLTTQVSFAATTSSASESAGTANLPVTLNAASASPVSVQYHINGGSANAGGTDYSLTQGVLTFAPGETAKNIVVTLNDDTAIESNETLVVTLKYPTNAKLGTSSHTLTITDNDVAPTVSVGFAGAAASGLESRSSAPLVVALSRPQATAVTVNFAVTGGTAISGSDFAITNGTLTFAVGETVKVVPNTIVNDAAVESNETIILTLSNPVGAVIANSVFTYTITDDDATSVNIVATDPAAAELGGSGTGLFTLTRTGATTAALTVNFSVSGTATSGSDYANIANSVVIAAGASSATVRVTPVDDTLNETSETVILTLTPGIYTIGAQSSATVTIDDNEEDTVVTVAASDATAAEVGNSGQFTVTRAGNLTNSLTVNLAVSGTASAGSDYTTLPTTVVIPAAAASVTIPVTPLSDSLIEGNETVVLTAIAGTGYSRGNPGSATVSIANTDDGSPPTLAPTSIVDDNGGPSAYINTLVTYTVTFSRDMDASTVTAADFGNAGTAPVTIGLVTETYSNSGVFTVQATPTNGGTLQLRVNAGAVLKSVAGTNLDTTAAIADDTTITVAGYPPTLADALDTAGLTWTTSGTPEWFPQTTTTHDGIDAAQSGAIGPSGTTSMQTTVAGPGTLSFWWKVSSESGNDKLIFYLDGVEQTGTLAAISGTVDWVQKSMDIPTGSHVLKWSYTKNGSGSSGSDTGWVDQVVFTPGTLTTLTWDGNGAAANLTDGAGGWQNPSQWWSGTSNVNWADGANATFGNGGTGGAVSLTGPISAKTITFNAFSGTYTLGTSGQALTLSSGITTSATSGAVTILSPIVLGSTQSWTNNSASALTASNAISGSAGLTKAGTGTLTLTGSNSYSGITTVSAGKLFINGNQATASGGVSVGTSATLGGTGTIGGNTTIAAGGKLEFTISTNATTHDSLDLAATKTLTFSGASVLTINSIAGASPGTYTLVTAPGGIVGAVPATVNLPAGWTATVAKSGNSLVLNVVATGVATLDHFAISPLGSLQTVGTPIVGITITAQDASNNTFTGFTGTVTFGGTGGFSGTSAAFTAGVLSSVSVTPTLAGSNLTFTVSDGASHTGSATIATVQSAFAAWSVGGQLDSDANSDGVKDGLAWALGASSDTANAVTLLPNLDAATDPSYLIYTFRRSDTANATATITAEYGTSLTSWSTAVHDGSNVIITVTNDFYGAGVDRVQVKLARSLAPSGRLFTRLKVLLP